MSMPVREFKNNQIQCNGCGCIIDTHGKDEATCPRCGKYHFRQQPTTKFAFFTAVVWLTIIGVCTVVVYYFVEWLKGLF